MKKHRRWWNVLGLARFLSSHREDQQITQRAGKKSVKKITYYNPNML